MTSINAAGINYSSWSVECVGVWPSSILISEAHGDFEAYF